MNRKPGDEFRKSPPSAEALAKSPTVKRRRHNSLQEMPAELVDLDLDKRVVPTLRLPSETQTSSHLTPIDEQSNTNVNRTSEFGPTRPPLFTFSMTVDPPKSSVRDENDSLGGLMSSGATSSYLLPPRHYDPTASPRTKILGYVRDLKQALESEHQKQLRERDEQISHLSCLLKQTQDELSHFKQQSVQSTSSHETEPRKQIFEYVQKIEILNRQLDAERELCEQLKQQNDEFKLQEFKIESQSQTIYEQQQQLQSMKTKIDELHTTLEDFKNQVKEKDNLISLLRKQIESLNKDIEEQKSAFQSQFEVNVQTMDRYREAQKELETHRTTIEMLDKVNRELTLQVSQLQESDKILHDEILQYKEKINTLTQQIESLQQENRNQTALITELREKYQTLLEHNDKLVTSAKASEVEAQTLTQNMRRMSEETQRKTQIVQEQWNKEREEFRRVVSTLTETLEKQTRDMTTMKQKEEHLQLQLANLQHEKEKIQTERDEFLSKMKNGNQQLDFDKLTRKYQEQLQEIDKLKRTLQEIETQQQRKNSSEITTQIHLRSDYKTLLQSYRKEFTRHLHFIFESFGDQPQRQRQTSDEHKGKRFTCSYFKCFVLILLLFVTMSVIFLSVPRKFSNRLNIL
jgi:chromosome segregation ATPase